MYDKKSPQLPQLVFLRLQQCRATHAMTNAPRIVEPSGDGASCRASTQKFEM
jgi:hypothetical protein